jgi:hypothetical protein
MFKILNISEYLTFQTGRAGALILLNMAVQRGIEVLRLKKL